MKKLTEESPNRDQRYQIVAIELRKMLTLSVKIKNPQFIRNAIILMLSFLNDRPINGFNPGNISKFVGNDKEKVLEILQNEFISN